MSTLNRCDLVSNAPIALVQKYWGLETKIVFVIIQPHFHFLRLMGRREHRTINIYGYKLFIVLWA